MLRSATRFQPRLEPVLAGLIALIISAPFIALVVVALIPAGDIWQHLGSYVLADYLIDSAMLCAGVATLTLLLGVVPAWLCSAYHFPGRRYIEWLLITPLALPPYVVAYIYTGMLDYGGDLHNWLFTHFDARIPIRSMGGGIAVLALTLYPYTYLFTRAVLSQQSMQLFEAGRTLNATPMQVFLRIVLPSLRPAMIVATAIVLMETLADFGTVQYFGINTFSVGILRAWFSLGSIEGAVQLALALLFFMAILLFLENNARHKKYQQKSGRPHTRLRRLGAFKTSLALAACLAPPLLGFVLPVAQLFVWLPRSTLDAQYFSSLFNSVMLATLASVLLLTLALVLAYTKRRVASRLVHLTLSVATSGYAAPGVVIAAGILVLAAGLNAVGAPQTLTLMMSGGFIGLFLAYTVRYMTLSFNAIDTALSKISVTLDDAARMLKTSLAGVAMRVHAPLITSGLFVAFLLAFVEVIKELPATLVLRPFNFNTLAVHIYELAADERLIDIAPYTLSLAFIGLLPIFVLARSIKDA